MDKGTQLAELLVDLFRTPSRLRRFLESLPEGETAAASLEETGSMVSVTFGAVDGLRSRGLIDTAFFDKLAEAFPSSAERIQAVRDDWVVDPTAWESAPEEPGARETESKAPTVFVSYARADRSYYEELTTHLSILRRKGTITVWEEGRLRGGDRWDELIEHEINTAEIILLLISADFLASDFAWGVEVKRALERASAGEARVIPIIVRPCMWEGTPLNNLQVLPADGRPIALALNADRAWSEVARSIDQVARVLKARQ